MYTQWRIHSGVVGVARPLGNHGNNLEAPICDLLELGSSGSEARQLFDKSPERKLGRKRKKKQPTQMSLVVCLVACLFLSSEYTACAWLLVIVKEEVGNSGRNPISKASFGGVLFSLILWVPFPCSLRTGRHFSGAY
ncbi:hypothetical protein ACFXTH_001467 [Malus domestica]